MNYINSRKANIAMQASDHWVKKKVHFSSLSVIRIHDYSSLRTTGNAAPKEIENHFSVDFPGMKCEDIQSHDELRSALEKRLGSTLSGCHSCNLKTVAVPGCESKANQRPKRATDTTVEVLFSLVVFKDMNSSSTDDSVEEKNEAVLFQMQYAVSTGQFMISLHGINTTARRSSLQHLFSKVTCSIGSVPSSDGKRCGEYLVVSFHSFIFCLFIY